MSTSTRFVLSILLAATAAGCGTGSPVNRTSTTVNRASTTVNRASTTINRTGSAARSPASSTARLIDHVHWGVTSKGRRLQVFPTRTGRTDTFPTAAKRAWAEVLVDAPNAGTAGMYDQFRCHWNYARILDPGKPSWNLEPWRPAVGYAATVAAGCNPGGSES